MLRRCVPFVTTLDHWRFQAPHVQGQGRGAAISRSVRVDCRVGQWATRYRCGEKSALVGRQKTRPALEILALDMLSALKAVAEVTEACAFHYGLRAREFDGRRSDLGDVIIKITDQECA